MATSFEHLPVELLYEIFVHFQLHEVIHIFTSLNSRLDAIVANLPHLPIYLGFKGMTIALTDVYRAHLCQPHVRARLLSLRVCNAFAFDNGLWFASHASSGWVNLRHLSFIDINRSTFEQFLGTFTPSTSLLTFSIRFTEYYRVKRSYGGVAEGAYYDQLFRLFPHLHSCVLGFECCMLFAFTARSCLPPNLTYMPIQTDLRHLRHLTIEQCSPLFLAHLVQHLPLLQHLTCTMTKPWLPHDHPLTLGSRRQMAPIDKSMVPNLRSLSVQWCEGISTCRMLHELFDRDVLLSLAKFKLMGVVAYLDVIQTALFMLSDLCDYALDVRWFEPASLSPAQVSWILWDAVTKLRGRLWVRATYQNTLFGNEIWVRTLPRVESVLRVDKGLHEWIVSSPAGQSNFERMLCSYSRRFRHIVLDYFPEMDAQCLSYFSSIVSCDEVSLCVSNPFNVTHLKLLLTHLKTLHILNIDCTTSYSRRSHTLPGQSLLDLLKDDAISKQLMAHGPERLVLSIPKNRRKPTLIRDIASLMIKQFLRLKVLDLHCIDNKLHDMVHILINGLPTLAFVTVHYEFNNPRRFLSRLRSLQKSNTRDFRSGLYDVLCEGIVFLWLQ